MLCSRFLIHSVCAQSLKSQIQALYNSIVGNMVIKIISIKNTICIKIQTMTSTR